MLEDHTVFVDRSGRAVSRSGGGRSKFVQLMSVTKLVVLLAFLECAADHGIAITDPVRRVFPEYGHGYSFADIINHRTWLQNDWGGSALQRRYFACKDIYRFALELKDDRGREGEGANGAKGQPAFRYNNYAYNILAAAVQRLSGASVQALLDSTPMGLLSGVGYRWMKGARGQPYASFGLSVRVTDLVRFGVNLHAAMRARPLPFFWSRRAAVVGRRRLALVGHDGTGGQYAYFDERSGSLLLWVYGGAPKPSYDALRTNDAFEVKFAAALKEKP